MEFKLVKVTPALAEQWLAGRAENRVVRKSIVALYCRLMLARQWVLTHQGIAFDEEGRLIDGQHRLMAVVASGVSVLMVVMTGVSNEAFEAIDRHIKRSVADCLRIDKDIAAAAQAGWGHEGRGLKAMLSPPEVRDVVDAHGLSLVFAVDNLTKQHVRGITTAPIISMVARAHAAGYGEERLRQFCAVLSSGEPAAMPDDQAALRLRNVLLSQDSRLHSGPGTRRKIMRAIQAFDKREPVTKLYAAESDLF